MLLLESQANIYKKEEDGVTPLFEKQLSIYMSMTCVTRGQGKGQQKWENDTMSVFLSE